MTVLLIQYIFSINTWYLDKMMYKRITIDWNIPTIYFNQYYKTNQEHIGLVITHTVHSDVSNRHPFNYFLGAECNNKGINSVFVCCKNCILWSIYFYKYFLSGLKNAYTKLWIISLLLELNKRSNYYIYTKNNVK